MEVYRITPSRLDEFRCHVFDEYNGTITQDKVIDSITGVKTWTPQASFGSAFALVVEHGAAPYITNPGAHPNDWYLKVFEEGWPEPIYLRYSEVKAADELHKKYPGATHEPWAWYDIQIEAGVVIKAPFKTDFLLGLTVHEVKTTKGKVDHGFYLRSWQWPVYLVALQADTIVYHIYSYLGHTQKRDYNIVKEPTTFKFHRYPDIERDVKNWFSRYLEFADNHGLLDYLRK